jgi:hypothetical protein
MDNDILLFPTLYEFLFNTTKLKFDFENKFYFGRVDKNLRMHIHQPHCCPRTKVSMRMEIAPYPNLLDTRISIGLHFMYMASSTYKYLCKSTFQQP